MMEGDTDASVKGTVGKSEDTARKREKTSTADQNEDTAGKRKKTSANDCPGATVGRTVRKKKKEEVKEKLAPLKTAAERIAGMLCDLSGEQELFVISAEEKQSRRIDTKTLKEFSSVIKEISWVICELNGITPSEPGAAGSALKIEFAEDAEECSR